jgi:pyridoxal phosphate-dependent aminotransferase EpsN
MGGLEQQYIQEAFASNWLSTVGPNLTAFEKEFEANVGLPSLAWPVAPPPSTSASEPSASGPGDTVFCSDLTFVASVNPIRYLVPNRS